MSRRRALSPQEQVHAEWLGMLQPEGLVVSIAVLVDDGAYVRRPPDVQQAIRDLCPSERLGERAALDRLLRDVLGWPGDRLAGPDALDTMAVGLPDLGVTLRPDLALLDGAGRALAMVAWCDGDLDGTAGDARWPVTWQARFERLLLESQNTNGGGTPVGLHASPVAVRLTYAPRGEAPGSLTFPIDALCAWDGRLLVDALCMLLGRDRLFTVAAEHRLLRLLEESRRRQEKVTEELAGQVEEALEILVAGVDVANAKTRGDLLRDYAGDEEVALVQDGLVTVLLRLVFVLYCEDQGVLPMDDPVYLEHYSLDRLGDRLLEQRVTAPEAMHHRYAAWARLCALFRLVFGGARHGGLVMPPREGDLFDPARHAFLEGRPFGSTNWRQDPGRLPPIDDGVVHEVLDRLVFLEGQRVSYRNLDVEQLGSVYEALMGFQLRRAHSLALPLKTGGWVEVGEVHDAENPHSALVEATGLKPAELARRAPTAASYTPTGDRDSDQAALVLALAPLVRDTEPRRPGQHYLQFGAERRRTGSHYTPTSLTRPIVERTLAPVVDRHGPPSSAHILGLKVCDPAMGSGAFLAEACRYLARRLLDAWTREGTLPPEARATDPLLVARRMVAERCLYGVDKNPFAVQLARMSLWLVTLAKDLPFTFVDHALREGDAVIGLTPKQIGAFSFQGEGAAALLSTSVHKAIRNAVRARALILSGEYETWNQKRRLLDDAQHDVRAERTMGDLLVACAWAGGTATEQRKRRARVGDKVRIWYEDPEGRDLEEECRRLLDALPLQPFHWELEFPEVFEREHAGFDAVVGNPPFGGKNTITATGGEPYIKVFQQLHSHVHGNADLASYFFLRAAGVLRDGGCFGLVATNTIKQGDTRATGLQHLAANGIAIYDATTDRPWPVLGGAAVVVDVVHGARGTWTGERRLNGTPVEAINSALEAEAELPDPVALRENAERCFIGSYVLGTGFLLSPAEARRVLDSDPANAEVVRPYIGGEELNSNPRLEHERYVIDFGERTLEEAERWPELIAIVREKVKPERDRLNDNGDGRRRKRLWWQFGRRTPSLERALASLRRCLACSQTSKHHLLAFQPTDRVLSHKLVVFAFDDDYSFAVLQSRVHEAWARHASLGYSMKTDPCYAPSTVFESFPFPRPTEPQRAAVAAAGAALYAHRSALMLELEEGMTKIWNRLLDRAFADDGIARLRELRDSMDRAVMDAYGWSDLAPTDTAALVRRLRALNAERAAEAERDGS